MAVIEKIRQRTGLVIGVISVALLSFLISDAVNSNLNIFGQNDNTLGEVAGEKITYEAFSKKLEERLKAVEAQTQAPVDDMTREIVRDQIWNEYFQDLVINESYKDLGLAVSDKEMFEEITNPVNFPQLAQEKSFQNEMTGQFDKTKFLQYYNNISSDPTSQAFKDWVNYEEKGIKPTLLQKKYNTLLQKSIFKTAVEVRFHLTEEQTLLDAKVAGLRYQSIQDTAVQVTEKDYANYLKMNPHKYQQEASRKIDYVLFDIVASAEDTLAVKTWADQMTERFATTTNDTLFVENNSETPFDTAFKMRGSFIDAHENEIFNAGVGKVVGPYYANGSYYLYKALAFEYDTVSYANVSHILVKPLGISKDDSLAALRRAQLMVEAIKAGASFDKMVEDSSMDYSTRSKKGSFGWIAEKSGKIQEAIEKVAFNSPAGTITAVRTQAGAHVVKVNQSKDNKKAIVAVVNKKIEFSGKTDNEVYNAANQFAAMSRTGEDFVKNAEEKGYLVRISTDLKENEKALPGIENAREIIKWAFSDEVKIGTVSDVVALGDKYIVAHLVQIKEKGLAKPADVMDKLKVDVLTYKKALLLKEQLEAAYDENKSIDQLALDLKTVASVVSNQNFSNNNIPYIGDDAPLLGALFGAEPNKVFGPVMGNTGVYYVYLDKVNKVQIPEDIQPERMRFLGQAAASATQRWFEALKKAADIKDYRYKFF